MSLADLKTMVDEMKMGLGPLQEFHDAALAGLQNGPPEQAAFHRLLADLASRFIDLYDEVPLWQAEAARWYAELQRLVAQSVESLDQGPKAQLNALNALAAAKF